MLKVLWLLGVLAVPLKSHHLPRIDIRRLHNKEIFEKVHYSSPVPIWQYSLAGDFICKRPGYFPDPQHCRYFYKCTVDHSNHLFRFIYRCVQGRVYSPNTNRCVKAAESHLVCAKKPEDKSSMEAKDKHVEPNQQTSDEITVKKPSSQDHLTNEGEEKQTPAQNLGVQSDGRAVNAPTEKHIPLFSIHTPDGIRLPMIELNVPLEKKVPGFQGIKNMGLKQLKSQLFGDGKKDEDTVPVQNKPPSIPEQQNNLPSIPERQDKPPSIPERQNIPPSIPERQNIPPSIPERQNIPPSIPERQNIPPSIPERQNIPPSIPERQNIPPSIPERQNIPPSIPERQNIPPSIPERQNIPPSIPERQNIPPSIPERQNIPPSIPERQNIPPSIPERQNIPPSIPERQNIPPSIPERQATLSSIPEAVSHEKNEEIPTTGTPISTITLPSISEREENCTTATEVQTGKGQPISANSTTLHGPELKEPTNNTQKAADQSVHYDGKNNSDCVDEAFHGVPEDSSKFYRCVSVGSHFVKYELQCLVGTIWDDSLKTCNFRAAIKEITCKDKSQPDTPTPPTLTTATTSTTPPVSSNDSDTHCPFDHIPEDGIGIICPTGFRQHPMYCNMFYQCISSDNFEGNFTSLVCPDDMVFNAERLQCEVNETRRQSCKTYEPLEKQDDGQILSKSNLELCPDEGRFIYGERCSSRYIECLRDEYGNLEGYLLRCPHGQMYSRIRDTCRPSRFFNHCLAII